MVMEGVVRGTSALRGSNTHYHPTNPVHDPASPMCELQTATSVTSENIQDNWSEAKDDSNQAINSKQMDSETPLDDGDGLANSEDSGINSDIWIESILNPSADIFIPHNSSRGKGDAKRDQDVVNSPDNNENCETREKEVPPVDCNNRLQAETAKRGRPKKGTRAPTRKSERLRN